MNTPDLSILHVRICLSIHVTYKVNLYTDDILMVDIISNIWLDIMFDVFFCLVGHIS